jgi:hypothetical protein
MADVEFPALPASAALFGSENPPDLIWSAALEQDDGGLERALTERKPESAKTRALWIAMSDYELGRKAVDTWRAQPRAAGDHDDSVAKAIAAHANVRMAFDRWRRPNDENPLVETMDQTLQALDRSIAQSRAPPSARHIAGGTTATEMDIPWPKLPQAPEGRAPPSSRASSMSSASTSSFGETRARAGAAQELRSPSRGLLGRVLSPMATVVIRARKTLEKLAGRRRADASNGREPTPAPGPESKLGSLIASGVPNRADWAGPSTGQGESRFPPGVAAEIRRLRSAEFQWHMHRGQNTVATRLRESETHLAHFQGVGASAGAVPELPPNAAQMAQQGTAEFQTQLGKQAPQPSPGQSQNPPSEPQKTWIEPESWAWEPGTGDAGPPQRPDHPGGAVARVQPPNRRAGMRGTDQPPAGLTAADRFTPAIANRVGNGLKALRRGFRR